VGRASACAELQLGRTFLLALALSLTASAADWKPLFDGKTLTNWRETEWPNHGAVRVEKASMYLDHGGPMTGVTYTGPALPTTNYEVRWEASRIKGGDFFSSLTFPVGDSFCTLVTGGWGGDIVGLSNIDGWDASENETRTYFNFEPDRFYRFRLRVTPQRITAWIDERQTVNVAIQGRAISLRERGGIKLSAPFGFASYNTTGAIRNVEYRTAPFN
jgi:hypothetical protein